MSLEDRSYREIQKIAGKLGVEKVVGVSRDDLVEAIERRTAEGELEEVEVEEAEEAEELEEEEEDPELEELVEDPNVAVIYNEYGNELRRYTEDIHGENFEELAEQLLEKNEDFTMELKRSLPTITCPSCGHQIARDLD